MSADPNGRFQGVVNRPEERFRRLTSGRDYFGITEPFTTSDGTIEINPSVSASFVEGRLVALDLSYLFMMQKPEELSRALAFQSLARENLNGMQAWALSNDSIGTISEKENAYRFELDTTGGRGTYVRYQIWYSWFRDDFQAMFSHW